MAKDPDISTHLHQPQVLGIDLGERRLSWGDSLKMVPLQSLTVATPQPATPAVVVDVMVDAIAQLDPTQQSIAIGVGTPGPADASGRIARVAINLATNNVPLADWLEKTGLPTVLANDANCAGLAEAWLGAGRQFRNLILLTLGTGVGGANLDRKLFIGHQGTAGNSGLITLNPDGPE